MKLESFSKAAIESADIDKAYEKALKFLSEVSPRINPADEEFIEHYGKDKVESDIRYVAEMEEKFSQESFEEANEMQKLAVIFEAIVLDQIYSSEWLGENADTVAASRYDDIKNGVDAIVEWDDEEDGRFLALAIDVTFAGDVADKFSKIKKGIDNESSRIKYFSHNGTIGLENVPRAVVGADAGTVKDLIELWLSGDNRAMAEHPIQIELLEEIISQMKNMINDRGITRIDYIAIVDLKNLEPIKEIKNNGLAALAVWIGNTRLIDNIIISKRKTQSAKLKTAT